MPDARVSQVRIRAPRTGRMVRSVAVGAVLAVACTGTTSCGAETAGGSDPSDLRGELVVHAASSLTDVFTELAATFESRHPDVDVVLNLAGSQSLATQVQQGAPGGVLATADRLQIDRVADLLEGPVRDFATNRLVLVVPSDNPAEVTSLEDLEGPDVTVVVADDDVPAGSYTATLLDRAGVTITPASRELDVRSVMAKVATGSADVGIVYATDAASSDDVATIPVDGADEVVATYPIAVLPDQADLGQAFVDLVLSEPGRAVLVAHGFGVP